MYMYIENMSNTLKIILRVRERGRERLRLKLSSDQMRHESFHLVPLDLSFAIEISEC